MTGAAVITTAQHIGNRRHQEDHTLWAEVPEGTLLGVFDGHGGEETSLLLAFSFEKFWSAIDGDDYAKAMFTVFKMADTLTERFPAGSTASVVFIPKDATVAYIGILGDSPVLAEQANGEIFIGPAHNARSNVAERDAAIARGGIYRDGYMWSGRLYDSLGLQMTRALGDRECSRFLSRVPEVFTIELGNWLLIGSDGLFDPTHSDNLSSDDEVIDRICKARVANDLVQQAIALPTNDNVSAILWRR